eukprot:6181662-Pleurochrysis_carterae.AAC.1
MDACLSLSFTPAGRFKHREPCLCSKASHTLFEVRAPQEPCFLLLSAAYAVVRSRLPSVPYFRPQLRDPDRGGLVADAALPLAEP